MNLRVVGQSLNSRPTEDIKIKRKKTRITLLSGSFVFYPQLYEAAFEGQQVSECCELCEWCTGKERRHNWMMNEMLSAGKHGALLSAGDTPGLGKVWSSRLRLSAGRSRTQLQTQSLELSRPVCPCQ